MTPRQSALLAAVARYIDEHGYAPSLRDLQGACGIPSVSTVRYNLRALAEIGLIQRESDTARSLCLTDAGRATVALEAR